MAEAKYQVIARELQLQIDVGEYVESTTLPTEFALAEKYKVSRQTIRQALQLLSEAGTIERRQGSGSYILRNNDQNSQSSAQPTEKRRTIAIIITYINNYIFMELLKSVEEVFSANNCIPLLFATNNSVFTERKILNSLLEMDIDGVLVEGTKTALPNPNLDMYRKLEDRQIPTVFFHGVYAQLENSVAVLDDNVAGGRQLVEHLYNKGHRTIGGVFKNDDIQGHRRYEGYATALRDLELPMEDNQLFWYSTSQKERFFSGELNAELDILREKCTALVCYNDEIANYIITYLLQQGVKVPEEMAVTSFDNSRISDLSPVTITSLTHGEYNVGGLAAQLLIRRMEGQSIRNQIVPWVLVEKQSS